MALTSITGFMLVVIALFIYSTSVTVLGLLKKKKKKEKKKK